MQSGRRKLPALMLAGIGLLGCGDRSTAAGPAPLVLEATLPLAGVQGRIDHLAIDPPHKRLFVAELGNGSIEALDLATGRSLGRVGGLKEPQGVAYLPARNELAVATGGDGLVRFYRADDLTFIGSVAVGGDADNLRLDARGRVVVGYGDGALAVIDPATRAVVAKMPLPGHPEGFQLDGDKAYVNVPDAGTVVSIDLAAGRESAHWRNIGGRFNFPLALEPGGRRFAVIHRMPGKLAIMDRATGQVQQSLGTCGDSDDAFFDATRHRLYVVCGGGGVDVFDTTGGHYTLRARLPTRSGARTGWFSPDLDRLYVAARERPGAPAAILVFRPAT